MIPPPLLSILCITKGELHARRFLLDMQTVALTLPYHTEFVVVVDGASEDIDHVGGWTNALVGDRRTRLLLPPSGLSQGYLESLHDSALEQCDGEYVLRIDDDERMNQPMIGWLATGHFRSTDHWKFDRAHLWQDEQHYIAQGPLWPDHQTRLSIKAKAGGRKTIHAGSPHGGGTLAPGCVIEHHCFLVRSREERVAKMARYNQVQPGAGWPAFNVPEIFFGEQVPVAAYSSARHPHDVA